ncbi:MAG: hypothetical protein ACD_71C00218G0002 [uncultured bacterium (gcode 4)]|uniref:Uncharacterized protein n=1 Tax=uncultured bacterium (gcode 4) TaxID=1234023 RepID=K1Z3T3_9BACT|nr:MAG: hypothetical protein ACD_71C00218G0002 [uncultured bacterium (gcode 4)]
MDRTFAMCTNCACNQDNVSIYKCLECWKFQCTVCIWNTGWFLWTSKCTSCNKTRISKEWKIMKA